MDKFMNKFKDLSILAAKRAGRIHKRYLNRDIKIKTKESSFDLVTSVDTEAEKAIVSIIRRHFPDHNIVAEEDRYEQTDSKYAWIIDPLDGTNNFTMGFPVFCVSIALAKDNDIILGVVYDPTRNELFFAQKGAGAYLNGKRIKVSSISELSKSLMVTGFYYDRGEDMIWNLEKIKRFFQKKIIGLRRLGSAALDLCYIASGRTTGFWEFSLNPWDFAAGKLLVEEAGGRITGKNGEPLSLKKSFVIASNGKIHDKILEILTSNENTSCVTK